MKTALITGVTGQDGAYLAEFPLQKGYIIHGIKRRSSKDSSKYYLVQGLPDLTTVANFSSSSLMSI